MLARIWCIDAVGSGGGRGDVGAEEDASNERVEHAREQERADVEDHQVSHVVGDVVTPLHLECA